MTTPDAFRDHFLHALNGAAHMGGGVLIAVDFGQIGLGALGDDFIRSRSARPLAFEPQPLLALDAFRTALRAIETTDAARDALRRLGGATSSAVVAMRVLNHLLCEDRPPALHDAPRTLADALALMYAHVSDRHTVVTRLLNEKIAADADASALVDAARLRIDLERRDRRTLAGTVPALAPLVRSEVPSWGLRDGLKDPQMRFRGLHDNDFEAPPAVDVPDGLLVEGEPAKREQWAAPVFVGLLPLGPRSLSLGAQPMGQEKPLGVARVPSADGATAAHLVPGLVLFCDADGLPASASSVLGDGEPPLLDVLLCDDLVEFAAALQVPFKRDSGQPDTVLMIT